jgi:hypothetical protein
LYNRGSVSFWSIAVDIIEEGELIPECSLP